jgi:hypothetical protein
MPAPVTTTAHPRPGTWPSPRHPRGRPMWYRCGAPLAVSVAAACGFPCVGAEPGKKSCGTAHFTHSHQRYSAGLVQVARAGSHFA